MARIPHATKVAIAVTEAIKKETNDTPRQRILDAASDITHNDRNKQYGNPEDNFRNIAAAWNAYLQAKGFVGRITTADVPIMMILMKTARLANNTSHWDSTVDIAGYAACLGDIQNIAIAEQAEFIGMMAASSAALATEIESATRRVNTNERNPKSK